MVKLNYYILGMKKIIILTSLGIGGIMLATLNLVLQFYMKFLFLESRCKLCMKRLSV